jgi:hypothetical protein
VQWGRRATNIGGGRRDATGKEDKFHEMQFLKTSRGLGLVMRVPGNIMCRYSSPERGFNRLRQTFHIPLEATHLARQIGLTRVGPNNTL